MSVLLIGDAWVWDPLVPGKTRADQESTCCANGFTTVVSGVWVELGLVICLSCRINLYLAWNIYGDCRVLASKQREGDAMSVTMTAAVEGMTCGHCVNAVTKEISALPGVNEVSVALEPEGQSRVTVSADLDIPTPDLEAAIAEAGYSLVEVERL